MEQKGNKGSKVAIVILILLVLGLGGYIAYDKLYAKEDKKVETKEKDETDKNEEIVDEEETSEEVLQVETEKTNFYNKYKNVDGSYGYIKSYSGYDSSYTEEDNTTEITYSIMLTADGYVKITYSEDEETNENGDIVYKKISNIENALDLVELSVVGSMYEQKYYILTADGKVYLYETSNLIDKKYKATLVKGATNIKSLKNYHYCPSENAGCSWFIISVDDEGNYQKLAEEGI